MRIAGGVIGIVVGVIQIIVMALLVFGAGVVGDMVSQADLTAAQAQLEELRATEGATEEQIAAAEEGLRAFEGVSGDIVLWSWVLLLIGVAAFVLGIMVCASKNKMYGTLLLLVGVAAVVIAVINWAGIMGVLWPALILLAGILAFAGAGKQAAAE